MELKTISKWLVVVGAINWGLSALGFNLVEMLLGTWPLVTKLVYLLIGAAGVWGAYAMLANRKK